MFCENCGAKNEDDALFCLTCGAKLEGGKKEGAEGSAPSDTNNAEGADAQQSADNVVPAANVEFDPETGEAITNDKKKPPITKIVGGVVGAVVVVGVVVGGVNLVKGVFTKSSSTYYKHAIIYMKDKEDLMVRKNGKKESYKIDDYDEYETPTIQVTDDGKTMFILNEEDDKLYYRSVNSTKPKKNESSEGTLISKNVNYFSIAGDGKFVIYDKDGKLCYNNLKDEQVIAKKYQGDYVLSKDKKKILFRNDDGDVEVATLGKKITSEVVIKSKDLEAGDNGASFVKYSEDFDEFLYVGDDKLYYKSGSKDAEQIAKNVVAANMLDGTIYYVVDETETKTFEDYIDDDCKSSDDKISYPRGSSSNSDWDKYYDKEARDYIRENYFDDELTVSKYKLCSYSGGKETVVDEQASSDFYINNVGGAQSATYSSKFPEITGGVLMYTKNDNEPNTVKLSDYDSDDNSYQIKDDIRYGSNDDDDDDKADVYAVCGGVPYEVDDMESSSNFTVIGKKVYAIVDTEMDDKDGYTYGDLVSFDIGKGLTNKETVAEDVSPYGLEYGNRYDDEDRKDPVYLVYGKDELGMLKNGKYTAIDSDVEYGEYEDYVTYKDGAVYYLADYDYSKGYGDLVYYKNGKSETIGSDVHQYIPRGKDVVVYISEYDNDDGTGDLCKKKGKGKEVVIDDEVSRILY